MKNLLITFFLCVTALFGFSQTPQAFNYQGLATNLNGLPLKNRAITIEASILEGAILGSAVYTETHQIQTDRFGFFSISIGEGQTIVGTFSAIDWGANEYFLQVGIDRNGGDNFSKLGTTQLLSVPYALHAANGSKWEEVVPDTRLNYENNVSIGNYLDPIFEYELSIGRNSSGTTGVSVLNPNLESRSIFLAGQANQRRYIYMGYLNPQWPSTFPVFEPGSGVIFTGGPNGMNLISAENDITFTTGGLNLVNRRMTIDRIGNVGIGTSSPKAKVEITDGDVYINDVTRGVIMKSPNGNCWRMTVSDTGEAVFTQISCP